MTTNLSDISTTATYKALVEGKYPVQRVAKSNDTASEKEVKAAVIEINPDTESMDWRG